jgi:hypothetical protein
MVKVTDPEPEIDVEERLAAKPPPLTLKLTGPLKPFKGETVTVEKVVVPAVISWKSGEAVRLKSPGWGGGGGVFTVSETLVLWTSIPLVPLMVRVLVPAGVDELVQTVRVEDPAPVTEAGLKLAVAFAGTPLTVNETVLLKPLTRAEIEAV